MIKRPINTFSRSHRPDYILIGTVFALLSLGIIILASASASFSQIRFGNTYYFLKHQLSHAVIPGLVSCLIFFFISLNFLKKIASVLLILNLLFLFLVFLPNIGSRLLGSSRWIDLGFVTFQPSEFLKLTFILYLAAWLEGRTKKNTLKNGENGGFGETLIAFIIAIGLISFLLLSQPDMSTLGIIMVTAAVMYFLADTPLWHSIAIFLLGIIFVAISIYAAPYRLNRFKILYDPMLDPMGKGFQPKQAIISVGSGGLIGSGLGLSSQKFGLLPESMSDAIFTIFAEEAGLIGSSILIIIFLVFLWRGFRLSNNIPENKFAKLLSQGLTFWIILQAFLNIAAMIGIFPIAGIPLPFISYGGSHLIIELTGVGILLNMSKNVS